VVASLLACISLYFFSFFFFLKKKELLIKKKNIFLSFTFHFFFLKKKNSIINPIKEYIFILLDTSVEGSIIGECQRVDQ